MNLKFDMVNERDYKKFDLNQLMISDEELRAINPLEVKNLRFNYDDVSSEEARAIITMLGYKDALRYTKWFFNSTLDKRFYLLGAKSVADGSINVNELKSSALELVVQDSIQTFGLTKKQLEQKQYRRTNPDTGHLYNAEDPLRSGHGYEHLDSRTDRLDENIEDSKKDKD